MISSTKPNQFQTLILDVEKGVEETFNNFDVFIRDYDEKKISNHVATLSRLKMKINYFLLFIKASPLTYLTDATFNSLLDGKGTFEGEECEVNIHGNLHEVSRSDLPERHFNGINLLGSCYLKSTSLILTTDYANDKVKLERSNQIRKIIFNN